MTPLEDLFASYSTWYAKKYVPSLIDDDPVAGMRELVANRWDHPLRSVRPLDAAGIARIERDHGPVPGAYEELLTTVGVGTILAASDDEPVAFRVLSPATLKKQRRLALESLSDEDVASVARRNGLDTSKMLAFVADGEDDEEVAFWLMLTRQTPDDDRVVLLERDHENGWPFGRKKNPAKSLHEVLARWVRAAKKLEPLNPVDGL